MERTSFLQDLNEINLYDIPIESIGFNTLPPDPSFQGFYYPQLQNYFPVYPPMQYTEHFSQYEQIPDFQVVGKKAKSKKRKPKTDPNAPSKPKRKTGLNKPLILSSVLSEFMDAKEVGHPIWSFINTVKLSRPELVQKLWKYIKENNLQDPADRRFILCDAKLKKVFLQDRVNSFSMNKDLSAHLTKKDLIPLQED